VDNPDKVQVTATDSEQGTTFLVTVAPTDVGKVIGKSGRTAGSLRLLLSEIGMTSKTRYSLDIVSSDSDGESPETVGRMAASASALVVDGNWSARDCVLDHVRAVAGCTPKAAST
jgi:predicted RNA-binding protein YlqC (UPF0109 family)